MRLTWSLKHRSGSGRDGVHQYGESAQYGYCGRSLAIGMDNANYEGGQGFLMRGVLPGRSRQHRIIG